MTTSPGQANKVTSSSDPKTPPVSAQEIVEKILGRAREACDDPNPDWKCVRSRALDALALDRQNVEAMQYLRAAEFRLHAEADGRVPQNLLLTAKDEQTGRTFLIVPEGGLAKVLAGFSAVYFISCLAALAFLAIDTWSKRYYVMDKLGFDQETLLTSPSFKLLTLAAVAGGIGATVDGIRSLISWHSEREAYGVRFIWKDLSLPWVGAATAVLAYLIVRSGAGVLNGDFSLNQTGGVPIISACGIASLAGFSAFQIFKWFDAQANKLFSVKPEDTGTGGTQNHGPQPDQKSDTAKMDQSPSETV